MFFSSFKAQTAVNNGCDDMNQRNYPNVLFISLSQFGIAFSFNFVMVFLPFFIHGIGMLPDIPLDRFRQVGNAAGAGAKAVLLSKAKRTEARLLARRIRYVELAGDPDFQKVFFDALRLGRDAA